MKLTLNINNGDVLIGDVKITLSFSIADIEDLKSEFAIFFVMKNNNGYTFYRSSYLNGGENSILFTFKENKIYKLNIGPGLEYDNPPYLITDEKKKRVKDILKFLGGEHDYRWGNVFYNEDNKGGNVNVGIWYNAEK